MSDQHDNPGPMPQTPAARKDNTPADGTATHRAPSLAVRVLLVLLSVVIALAILAFVAWITGDRLKAHDNPLGTLVLPKGSTMVPRTFPGAGATYTDKLLTMARVPGHEAAVSEFFVRQAADRGWQCTVRPPKTDGSGPTLVIETGGAARMIVIREAPSGKECTVGVYDFADR